MKVLMLVDESSSASGQAVVRRVLGDYLPLLSGEVDCVLVTLRGLGNTHVFFRNLGIQSSTLAMKNGLFSFLAFVRLIMLIRRERPDIVEGHEPICGALVAAASVFTPQPVSIFFRHHTWGGRTRFRRVALRLVDRFAAKLTNANFVASKAVAEEALRDGVPKRKVRVVYAGAGDLRSVRPEEVEALLREFGVPSGALVIGAVARMRYEKGIDVLIESLPLLRRATSFPRVNPHILIVGDGPEHARLSALANEIGSDQIHLVGHQNDIALWYRSFDVLVIPSRKEAFGRTACEGMAAGLPVVASRVGGIPEVIGEDGALFVEPDDPAALAESVARILSDPVERAALGSKALVRYNERFSLSAQKSNAIASWRQVVHAKRQSGQS